MGECYAELEKDDVETLLEEETEVVEGEVGRARAQHSPHVARCSGGEQAPPQPPRGWARHTAHGGLPETC